MKNLLHDLRYGFRLLGRNRAFTALAVLALALGIGANTAVFSTADALLFKPLNLSDMDRLVALSAKLPERDVGRAPVAIADYLDWQSQQTSFTEMTAYRWQNANLTGTGEPQRVACMQASVNFFHLLQVEAARGRTFAAGEEEAGQSQVVVLTHALWMRRFGGDPNVINTTIALNGRSHTVIGVMPEDFDYPRPAELWAPLALTNEERENRKDGGVFVVGRLKPETELGQARADIETLARRLEEQHPQTNTSRGARVELLSQNLNGDYSAMFIGFLLGAAGFVLLIACVNIANMQLARATSRYREIAVRAALGATRGRIIRQLLTESVALAFVGGVAGLLLAVWFVDLIRNSLPLEVVRFISGWRQLAINERALLFTLATALVSGIIFGVAPALQFSRPDLNETLKEGGRSNVGGGKHRLRGALIVAEIALALVLLVGTGLMVQGFSRLLENQKQGFQPENLMTFSAGLPVSRYQNGAQLTTFYQQALAELQQLPGVEAASLATSLPASDSWNDDTFQIEGEPPPPPGEERHGTRQSVSSDYFRALRIPLVGGREFRDSDNQDAPPVAIISAELARRYFPNQDPLGKRIQAGGIQTTTAAAAQPSAGWHTIVGIVGDVRRFMLDRDFKPTLYLPYAQTPERGMVFALRTTGEPTQILPAARAVIGGIDSELPLYNINTMEEVITAELSGIRLIAGMMAIFGLMALVLAGVGVYGVMAYAVTQRTQEIGIRLALGAQPADVIRLVMKQGLLLTAIGLGAGLPLALGLSNLMAGALFGVVAMDALPIVGFTLLLLGIAMLSSYLPARRAAKVAPLTALR